jgi:hypothetical protein
LPMRMRLMTLVLDLQSKCLTSSGFYTRIRKTKIQRCALHSFTHGLRSTTVSLIS